MIRRVIAGAALCSAFSAFAASHLPTDRAFDSASRPTSDHVAAGNRGPYGSSLDDATMSVGSMLQPGTLAMAGAALLGLVGLMRRRRDL